MERMLQQENAVIIFVMNGGNNETVTKL